MEAKPANKHVLAQELLGRFRSKEDLHRYLTQQGRHFQESFILVGVFLPSMKATSLDFMRDILKESKLHLKANEVIHLDIPHYQELSVKNMYEDAMKDEVLIKYLPTKKQLSNKLPEREFFFGVLSTLRRQYMTDVIKQAHDHRYKAPEDDAKKEGIVISSAWMEELTKHPYFSSKLAACHIYRETWNRNLPPQGEGQAPTRAPGESQVHAVQTAEQEHGPRGGGQAGPRRRREAGQPRRRSGWEATR